MQLKSRAVRAKRDERRRAEKRIRLLVDDLRYALKKVDPPIDVEVVTYEQAVPLVSETEEWKALEGNDEARVQAWDKFVRRQRVRVSLSLVPSRMLLLRGLMRSLFELQEKRAAEMDRVDRDRLYERERDAERERDREATRRSRPAAGHDEPMEGVEGAGEGGGGGGALAGDVRRSSRTGLDASQLPYDDSGEGRRAGEGGGRKRTASDRGVMEGGAKDSMDAAEGAAVGPATGDDEAGRDGARGPDRKVPRLETAAGGGSDDVTMSVSFLFFLRLLFPSSPDCCCSWSSVGHTITLAGELTTRHSRSCRKTAKRENCRHAPTCMQLFSAQPDVRSQNPSQQLVNLSLSWKARKTEKGSRRGGSARELHL